MKEVKLPSGRVVKVKEHDIDHILVEFKEQVTHRLVFPKTATPEEVDEGINKYLYGYDDPETGEYIDGYFDRIKKKQEEEKEKWW